MLETLFASATGLGRSLATPVTPSIWETSVTDERNSFLAGVCQPISTSIGRTALNLGHLQSFEDL